MRTLGTRRTDAAASPSGEALVAARAHLQTAAKLAAVNTTGISCGVYRFKSHMDANRHAEECLSRAIAQNLRARATR